MGPTTREGRATRLLGLGAGALLAAPVLVGAGYAGLGAVGLAGAGAHGMSLDRLAATVADRSVWRGGLWTLWVAAASTALATAAAAALAMVWRGTGWQARTGRLLTLLPLPVPHIAAAVGALLVLGQSGLLARLAFLAGLISGPQEMPALVYDRLGIGLILALTWKEIPFLALIAGSVLATRGDALEATARGLGAGPFQTAWLVTWPVLWRGMLPGVVAVFTFAAGSYEMAAILAPSDPLALPLAIWERYTGAALSHRADAYVLALAVFILSGMAVLAHEWTRRSPRREAGPQGEPAS